MIYTVVKLSVGPRGREDDWKGLNANELRERLAERRVIEERPLKKHDAEESEQGEWGGTQYSEGLMEIYQQMMEEKKRFDFKEGGENKTRSVEEP